MFQAPPATFRDLSIFSRRSMSISIVLNMEVRDKEEVLVPILMAAIIITKEIST